MPRVSPDFRLVQPTIDVLPSYVTALEQGWSPDNLRHEAAHDELIRIQSDADLFIKFKQDDREAKAGHVVLPDGSSVKRLPGFIRWMWDGDFCGSIGFRWAFGTSSLPEHVLGHIGYAVVPWKRNKSYATEALRLILLEAYKEGLSYVELTTTPDNVPSQRVITANGGVLYEQFIEPPQYGTNIVGLRYRIDLSHVK